MTERRQAFRREPIEIDLGGLVISVGPVSWLKRNDFGSEVMRQHSEILNDAVRIYLDETTSEAIPQLEAKFGEKFKDPYALFELGLEPQSYEAIPKDLSFTQIVAILLAICDVNQLSQLYPLLDPNSQTPTKLGGILSNLVASGDDTLKTESSQDSASPELPEPTPIS